VILIHTRHFYLYSDVIRERERVRKKERERERERGKGGWGLERE
jgi:hypothetical protein